MFLSHLQNIAIGCCVLLFIIVNLSPITSGINSVQKEKNSKVCVTGGCNTTCANLNGSYLLEFKEDCNVYYVNLGFENSASIINLTTYLKPTFNITLDESTIDIQTDDERISLGKWTKNLPSLIPYLSRSSKVFIAISGTGNWSYYEIKFSFNEIQHRLFEYSETENGKLTVAYRPNSVFLLSLRAQAAWRGVNVSFDKLTINAEMGEYILIGIGTYPFENKYSRPLYITQVPENSTFFVDDSSAFVAYVSGLSHNINKDFEILWTGMEKKNDKMPDDKMGILNSSLICFYNYSEATAEAVKDKDKRFQTFRQNFSEIAQTGYLPREFEDIVLDYKSIDLFGPPTNITGINALSFLIKVTHERKSILTWRTLQNIIEEFNETRTSSLKVGKCPEKSYDYYKDEYHVVFYAFIPVFGLFGLMIWAWKQNIFAQNCWPEKEEKMFCDVYDAHAEPNAYGTTTVPKIRYDEEGRSETLYLSSSQQEDQKDANDTTTVEMTAFPSTSQEQNTLTRYLSSKRNKSRPSIQSLWDNVEENNKQSHSRNNEENDSDHLYDSVSSSKQLDETKL